MKIIHIESGLGNQMLSYCEYLAIKKVNPDDDCYIETIIYDIPACNDVVCQWNGYELDEIFGLDTPNIKNLFSPSEWAAIMEDIKSSEFWLKNWNYPVYFCKAFNRAGIDIENRRGDFEAPGSTYKTTLSTPRYKKTFWFQYLNFLRRKYIKGNVSHPQATPELFIKSDKNIFTGQQLTFKNTGSGIERIDQEIRNTFTFPSFTDEKNITAEKEMSSVESVAIHTRRGDMLSYNFDCYYGGYFKRCMSYIKKTVPNPHFYIFCDTGSVEWAKHHEKTLGLDFRKDEVSFVDWNTGRQSWKDMQLMASCKHQIITRSSFGWWAAYLNNNPNKITCSPDEYTNTTHHF